MALRYVSDGQPNCDTTIYSTGQSFEDDYETAECMIYFKGSIAPIITWTGPQPYTTYYQTGVDFVWSGVELYVNRSMDSQRFTAVSKFADSMAWQFTFSTPVLFVSCMYFNFCWVLRIPFGSSINLCCCLARTLTVERLTRPVRDSELFCLFIFFVHVRYCLSLSKFTVEAGNL